MANLHFTPLILAHAIAALGAVGTGGAMLLMKKGTSVHRWLGRTWVGLMAFTALVSFGIQTKGHFTWIHLLSAISLTAMALSIAAVMRGNIARHRHGMTGVYIGLVIAGIFALMPQRRFGALVWQAAGLL